MLNLNRRAKVDCTVTTQAKGNKGLGRLRAEITGRINVDSP